MTISDGNCKIRNAAGGAIDAPMRNGMRRRSKNGRVMTRLRLGWLVCLLLLCPVVAQAQVKNPTQVEFTSPDHALLSAYEVDIVRADSTVAQTLTIAASMGVVQPNGNIRLMLNVQPIAFGQYTIVVRAVAGTLESDNSPASDPWERVPGAPSKPVVK
jgi:hypothetical protein